MMRRLLLAVFLAGCGSDPAPPPSADPDADADGDYLSDAAEAVLGTDPHNPDTDGDGYLDGDEVLEGTDPLDPESRIYRGGWPYQRFKDDIPDPGFDGTAAVDSVVPRLVGIDQFGDLVDLYDFAGHGKKMVIDLSASWCAACRDMAQWLDGETSASIDPGYATIPERVASGEIFWVTILFEDASGSPADATDVTVWYDAYPNPHVAVIADDDRALSNWFWPGAYPALFVVDETMALRVYDRYDYTPALDALLE
jgi:hypothetical protein